MVLMTPSTAIVFPFIVVTSLVSSSVMVAPSDDSPGRWKYFSSSKYPSNNLRGVDTYIRLSCSPTGVPVLLGQVLFVSGEAPGLSDQAP